METEKTTLRTIVQYGVVTALVALVSSAVMLSYSVTRTGQSMSGVVVKKDQAALDIEEQPGATTTLKIDRVVAPEPSWIVVTQVVMGPTRGMMAPEPEVDPDAPPPPEARILAIARVPKGEERDLIIPLQPGVPLTQMLLVSLHADRGVRGTYEFNMNRFAESPDKPYFRLGQDAIHTPLQLGRNVAVK